MPKRAKPLGPRTPQQESQSRGTDFLGSAARVEDILAINLPPDVRQRTRFSKSGKRQRRYTLEIETEPIFHDLESPELGRRSADTLAFMMGENIRKAGKKASEATKKIRGSALRRIQGGDDSGKWGRYLMKRWS